MSFVLAIILTIVACVFFNNDVVKLILLIAMPWLTVVAELLNSAVEAVVDRIGTEYHELSGRAKDLGSAAVFVMLILTLVTWILIVLTKFGILN